MKGPKWRITFLSLSPSKPIPRKAQRYGAAHQLNWKKVGLSTAYFKRVAVTEASMPTRRAAAALRYLLANNAYYKTFWDRQKALLETDSCLSISSFDLFIIHVGIECAMFPILYPKASWSDTGGLKAYKVESNDQTTRTVSIGRSWTRKVCSSVRVYAEQRDLTFFCTRRRWQGSILRLTRVPSKWVSPPIL